MKKFFSIFLYFFLGFMLFYVWSIDLNILKREYLDINGILSDVNKVRVEKGMKPLRTNDSVNSLLSSYGIFDGDNELKFYIDKFNNNFEDVSASTAYKLSNVSEGQLINHLKKWDDLYTENFTHLYMIRRATRLGFKSDVFFIISERLPFLDLSKFGKEDSLFHDRCSICKKINKVEVRNDYDKTMILNCGYCKNSYALLARGSSKNYKYACDFMGGLDLSILNSFYGDSDPGGGVGSEEEILSIWKKVVYMIDYSLDKSVSGDDVEVWMEASKTFNLGVGDCEDISILLSSILISKGYDARVALGKIVSKDNVANDQDHAWTVVRFNNKEYLLETTSKNSIYLRKNRLPTVSEVGSRYRVNAQFDSKHVYFKKSDVSKVEKLFDYWDKRIWNKIK